MRTPPDHPPIAPGRPDSSYGRRLSRAEYIAAAVRIRSEYPPIVKRAQQREIMRRELDLAIDYRLGVDFPSGRREALWRSHRRLDSLILARLAFGFIMNPRDPASYLLRTQAKAYSGVLSVTEASLMLGIEEHNFRKVLNG